MDGGGGKWMGRSAKRIELFVFLAFRLCAIFQPLLVIFEHTFVIKYCWLSSEQLTDSSMLLGLAYLPIQKLVRRLSQAPPVAVRQI